MIYLLKSGDYLKIGLTTRSAEQRIRELQTGNPEEIEIIDTRKGGKDEELLIHSICEPWSIRGEWFEDCSEVRNIFSNVNLEKLYEYKDYSELEDKYNKLEKKYKSLLGLTQSLSDQLGSTIVSLSEISRTSLDSYIKIHDVIKNYGTT